MYVLWSEYIPELDLAIRAAGDEFQRSPTATATTSSSAFVAATTHTTARSKGASGNNSNPVVVVVEYRGTSLIRFARRRPCLRPPSFPRVVACGKIQGTIGSSIFGGAGLLLTFLVVAVVVSSAFFLLILFLFGGTAVVIAVVSVFVVVDKTDLVDLVLVLQDPAPIPRGFRTNDWRIGVPQIVFQNRVLYAQIHTAIPRKCVAFPPYRCCCLHC